MLLYLLGNFISIVLVYISKSNEWKFLYLIFCVLTILESENTMFFCKN